MKEQILNILKANPQGLSVQQVVEQLRLTNSKVSPRGVRELINQMFDAQEMKRRKHLRDTPGKPAYLYIHNDFHFPQNLFDEMAKELGFRAVIITKSQMMYEMLPEHEKEAHLRGVAVLKRLKL
ncbi:hypothetical protein [Nostoc sp. FACHB-145]|uniref:hypothetical protein n=1 Tax=Nostoc sp. FACHB-145 TaxID=2692836 RepID=UPI0016860271|nr:hypothetical protein [Nostoc sp. FACHB-145]MBD2473362.1 hypothetical protein [Nostoc sp. FACHB-145]